mmetsp:Transcript_4022/g.12338  ORF Transcript_4022/g.12338 Transcript_4022/m.12338 type:complete len:149 (-) Transcript_4022:3147-3593(-)
MIVHQQQNAHQHGEMNRREQQQQQQHNKNVVEVFVYDSLKLLKIPTFLLTLSGFSWYSLVLGVFSAWGPKAGFALFKYELGTRSNADAALGMVTVFCGVFGTLLGGIGVDYFAQKKERAVAKSFQGKTSTRRKETSVVVFVIYGRCRV